jgi:hypothetical protein
MPWLALLVLLGLATPYVQARCLHDSKPDAAARLLQGLATNHHGLRSCGTTHNHNASAVPEIEQVMAPSYFYITLYITLFCALHDERCRRGASGDRHAVVRQRTRRGLEESFETVAPIQLSY